MTGMMIKRPSPPLHMPRQPEEAVWPGGQFHRLGTYLVMRVEHRASRAAPIFPSHILLSSCRRRRRRRRRRCCCCIYDSGFCGLLKSVFTNPNSTLFLLPALPVVGGGNAAEGGILAPGAESGDRVPERGPFENKEEEKGGGGSYMRE